MSRRGIGARSRQLGARLGQGIVVVFGAATISFALIHLSGNPAEVIFGTTASPEAIAEISQRLGYDRPLHVQYVDYMSDVARGDFGDSLRYQEPALNVVLEALPRTLLLVTVAMAIACAVALVAAVFSVLRRETRGDRVVRRTLMVFQGLPEFWLGLVLVMIFAVKLGWLPSIGMAGPKSVILPSVALALPLAAILTRLLRATLLDIMASDFVTALRGKGLSEVEIITHHALRNASVPFVNYLGLKMGWLIGGTLVVETVFVWPGIGQLALSAVDNRDLAILQTLVIVIAVIWILLNLVVDLLMAAIDPRIRSGQA